MKGKIVIEGTPDGIHIMSKCDLTCRDRLTIVDRLCAALKMPTDVLADWFSLPQALRQMLIDTETLMMDMGEARRQEDEG